MLRIMAALSLLEIVTLLTLSACARPAPSMKVSEQHRVHVEGAAIRTFLANHEHSVAVSGNIQEGGIKFLKQREETISIEMLSFNERISSEQVLKIMREHKLRPATLDELLATLSSVHQRQGEELIALGSVSNNYSESYVPIARGYTTTEIKWLVDVSRLDPWCPGPLAHPIYRTFQINICTSPNPVWMSGDQFLGVEM